MRLVLVALKCDLREGGRRGRAAGLADGSAADEGSVATPMDDGTTEPKQQMVTYKQGLAVAERIRALRYLGTITHHLLILLAVIDTFLLI